MVFSFVQTDSCQYEIDAEKQKQCPYVTKKSVVSRKFILVHLNRHFQEFGIDNFLSFLFHVCVFFFRVIWLHLLLFQCQLTTTKLFLYPPTVTRLYCLITEPSIDNLLHALTGFLFQANDNSLELKYKTEIVTNQNNNWEYSDDLIFVRCNTNVWFANRKQ